MRRHIRKPHIKRTIDRKTFQALIWIYVIICTIFALLPIFVTALSSMKGDSAIVSSLFGFDVTWVDTSNNYSLAFSAIRPYFIRTIILALIGATVDVILGSVLAYVFTFKNFPGKNFFFMLFISVMLIPSIMGMPILYPFVKETLGLTRNEFSYYVGYLLPNFAGGQVTALFLFRTFFSQQPKDLYESAKIEGANDFIMFFKITLPLAFPIILFQFVGKFSGFYNDYLWPSLLFTAEYSTLMPMLVTLQGGLGTMGADYAMYMISSIPLIVVAIISMKHFASGDFASGMKL